MLLNGYDIGLLIATGSITGADGSNINAASLDVSIGDHILVQKMDDGDVVDPRDKSSDLFRSVSLPYPLTPGELVLAYTKETVHLPDTVSAQLVTKSSCARVGLAHLMAGWIDAGYTGQITLALYNYGARPILLTEGLKVVQLKFFKHGHAGAYSYSNKGQYNGSVGIATSKGVR